MKSLHRPNNRAAPVGELTLKGFHRPVTTHNVIRVKA